MPEIYGEFTRQWNLLERTLRQFGDIKIVEKLKRYGADNSHMLDNFDQQLLEGVLTQNCVYDEKELKVKSYVRESYAFLRRNRGIQPEICQFCPPGIQCSRVIGRLGYLNFTSSLLLIVYQIRNNYAHLGKFDVTERNTLLLHFAMEVLRIVNHTAYGIKITPQSVSLPRTPGTSHP